MENKEKFIFNEKYKDLSDVVKKELWKLDDKLCSLNHFYNGVWRNDKKIGGNVFIFELLEKVRKRKNIKNLITLRPQKYYLKVEVYWREKDKNFYKIDDDGLFQDIDKKFQKIGILAR